MTVATAHRSESGDLAYQREILEGVARTFALTLRALPGTLYDATGNLYLLCRIADTIEDEPTLSPTKRRPSRAASSNSWPARETRPSLPASWGRCFRRPPPRSERDLVANTPRVLRVTARFSDFTAVGNPALCPAS